MKRVPILLLGMMLLGATVVVACSAAAPSPAPRAPGQAPASPLQSSSPQAPGSSQNPTDRMIVRTVSLRLVVTDVDEVLSRAASLAQEMGGFVVSSESRDQVGQRVGTAALRVPTERLDESVKRLKGMATRVNQENSSAKDVTEEYVDQDARLRNLRATEDQYLQVLQKATTIEEILKVQQSISQVREQIERTQGRMEYLRRTTETATINLELSAAAAARPVGDIGWTTQEVFHTAVQALVGMFQALAALAIWVVVFVPVWVPTALLVLWWRRREQRRPSPAPPPKPTTDLVS